jgi:hypothetical protein
MWDDMIAAKEKLMQNAQSRSLEHINKKTKFEAITLSDVHASEMMLSFNENDFLNAEMAAEVYVLPKFTPTQTTSNSSFREENSSVSNAQSNRESSTLNVNIVPGTEENDQYPSCGIIDFGNALDQVPECFDELAYVDAANDFAAGFDEVSVFQTESVASKQIRKNSGKQSKITLRRPKYDAKTVSFM